MFSNFSKTIEPRGPKSFVAIVNGARVDFTASTALEAAKATGGKVIGYVNKRGGVTAIDEVIS